jgi:hypothetical protein
MESIDQEWAALQEWPICVDERGFATVRELAMARAPLLRAADRVVPWRTLRGPEGPTTGRGSPQSRSRPGKRW